MDCSLPGFSVRGIFQARVQEWANTQTASPRALADSLMQLARQVSRLESGQ